MSWILRTFVVAVFAVSTAWCCGAVDYLVNMDKEWASTDDAFDPLADPDAITFEAMREKFGAIPGYSGSLRFAGNVK
ncbi:MAG: hypothetical protein LIP18_03630, partial [Planctomycetes bacterium]|nr:hypothetical protein [Planctomycetota bacterium]